MLILSLFWLLIGILIGGLANAAKLRPAAWGRGGWLRMLGLSALVALLAGWLGTLLLGTLFATPAAVWITTLGVVVLPWLITRVEARSGTQGSGLQE